MMKQFALLVFVCLIPAFAVAGGDPVSAGGDPVPAGGDPVSAGGDPVSAGSAALTWLLARRAPDGGWGRDTVSAVTALQLTNSSALGPADHQLVDKQLQIELLADIWRQRESPLTSARLADYVLALVSSCIGVTDFQGKDLIAMMRHRLLSDDSEVAVVALASCLAGTPLRRRRYLQLLTSIEADRAANISTGRLAFSVLALRCVTERDGRRAEQHLAAAARRLAARQQPDGGFGDLDSTLLAVQALRSEESVGGWDEAAALGHLLSQQSSDGSLGSVRQTAAAAGLLSGRSLLDVTETRCHHHGEDGREPADVLRSTQELAFTVAPTLPSVGRPGNSELPPSPRLTAVTLWLWIGDDVAHTFSRQLSVPRNSSVFQCLQLAAQRDDHFQFSGEIWPNGHYIHTIAGYREEQGGGRFWVMYRLPSAPDPANKPDLRDVQLKGVDWMVPSDGEHVLFWYREL